MKFKKDDVVMVVGVCGKPEHGSTCVADDCRFAIEEWCRSHLVSYSPNGEIFCWCSDIWDVGLVVKTKKNKCLVLLFEEDNIGYTQIINMRDLWKVGRL